MRISDWSSRVLFRSHHAGYHGDDRGGGPEPDHEAGAVVVLLSVHELLLDVVEGAGRGLDAGRAGLDGGADAAVEGHRSAPKRSDSALRAREACVLTDPVEMPSVLAISASERSR